MGLYSKVVTYFFLYRWVALSTITPSLGKQRTEQEEAENSAMLLTAHFLSLIFTYEQSTQRFTETDFEYEVWVGSQNMLSPL